MRAPGFRTSLRPGKRREGVAIFRFRRWTTPALLVPPFVALGCTSLLGIDGNYQSAAAESGGAMGLAAASGVGGDGAGGAGGDAPAGDGGDSNAGGRSESGGTDATGSGGAGGAGGGTAPPGGGGGPGGAGDTTGSGGAAGTGGSAGTGSTSNGGGTSVACTPGTYVGTYSGTHKTSSTATIVQVFPSGTVTAQVTNADGGMPTMSLTFARAGLPLKDGFDAKVTFTFDCSENAGSGPFQKDATMTAAIPYVNGPIEGSVQASFGTPATLKGTYSEDEVLVPDYATGKGSWEATLR
jgi:hypothetical protein